MTTKTTSSSVDDFTVKAATFDHGNGSLVFLRDCIRAGTFAGRRRRASVDALGPEWCSWLTFIFISDLSLSNYETAIVTINGLDALTFFFE